jgi:hypothetical protein
MEPFSAGLVILALTSVKLSDSKAGWVRLSLLYYFPAYLLTSCSLKMMQMFVRITAKLVSLRIIDI